MTTQRIEPATFLLVAQGLKQMRVPSLPTASWTTLNMEAVRPSSTSVSVSTQIFPTSCDRIWKGQRLPWPHELYLENKWEQNSQLQNCWMQLWLCNLGQATRHLWWQTFVFIQYQILLPYLRPTINSGFQTNQEVGRNMTSTPAYKPQTLKRFGFCNFWC
jgi:hypothetical protein